MKKKKNFTTIRRFGTFVTEIPRIETVVYEWIIANVPPLHDIRNTTRSFAISEFTPYNKAIEIAKRQGYTFE